jgi:hypothetical protein
MKKLITVLLLSTSLVHASVITSRSRISTAAAGGAGSGDFSSNTSSSVDGEIVLFSGTAGKTGKRATGTGPAKVTSGVLSAEAIALGGSEVSGTLPATKGGTGIATYTTGDLLYSSATDTLSKLAAGSNGNVVVQAAGIPSWAAQSTLAAGTAAALASNPSDCASGEFATAIAANGNLTCTALVGTVETVDGHIETATAKPFILKQYAEYAFTVNRITSQCDSGTADFDLEINGTNVTGCASQQMASSEAVDTCTAANSVAVGDTLSLNVTAVSSPDDCRFTVKITR